MGLFDFLGGLFGGGKLSKKDMEEVRKEISFADAISAHAAWKNRLDKYVDGTSEEELDPSVICQDNRCVLGKWIHGAGDKRFGHDASFSSLRENHATFHYHAAKIVEHCQCGEKEKAKSVLAGDYAKMSKKVIGTLLELNQAFGGDKK